MKRRLDALTKKTSISAEAKEKYRRVLSRNEFVSSEEDTPRKTRFAVHHKKYDSEALKRVKVSLDLKADSLMSERGRGMRKPRVDGEPSDARTPAVGQEDAWAIAVQDDGMSD